MVLYILLQINHRPSGRHLGTGKTLVCLFAPSSEHCLIAVLPSDVNLFLALEQEGRQGMEQDFGRQMYHTVLSVGPSWTGCNSQMVMKDFLHSSKPCGQSTLFIFFFPCRLIWPVCQDILKCDTDHLSPGLLSWPLQSPTTVISRL